MPVQHFDVTLVLSVYISQAPASFQTDAENPGKRPSGS